MAKTRPNYSFEQQVKNDTALAASALKNTETSAFEKTKQALADLQTKSDLAASSGSPASQKCCAAAKQDLDTNISGLENQVKKGEDVVKQKQIDALKRKVAAAKSAFLADRDVSSVQSKSADIRQAARDAQVVADKLASISQKSSEISNQIRRAGERLGLCDTSSGRASLCGQGVKDCCEPKASTAPSTSTGSRVGSAEGGSLSASNEVTQTFDEIPSLADAEAFDGLFPPTTISLESTFGASQVSTNQTLNLGQQGFNLVAFGPPSGPASSPGSGIQFTGTILKEKGPILFGGVGSEGGKSGEIPAPPPGGSISG